jgi:preprotein translocase subunit SecA
VESFATYAGAELDCQLEPRDFLNMDFEMASSYAHDQAERQAEVTVAEIVEENLPEEMEDEWNWKALANWANTRQGANYQEHQLKNMDRDQLIDELIKKCHTRIAATDLSDGAVMLDADFGLRTLSAWMRHKFGIETTPDEFRDVEDRRQVAETLFKRAEEAYSLKEAEYPVLTGLSRFTEKQGSQLSLDREGLVQWVARRFGVQLNPNDIRLNRDELKNQLIEVSRQTGSAAEQQYQDAEKKVEEVFEGADSGTTAAVASGGNGALDALAQWLEGELDYHAAKEDLSRMNRQELELAVDGAVDDRFHPEMRRMERSVLLQIVDDAWKNHLLTMDHLRSSVGLKGYAQMDPKVEYKREGMRLFESMWESIGERVTDLIFRMESLNEEFIRSTWVEGQARHDEAESTAAMASQSNTAAQRAAESSNRSEPAKPETVRHKGPRVGRNDPCPCGSGKKFKACHMRKQM